MSLGGPRTTSATLVASFWPAPVGLCVLIALCLTTFTALAQRHNILLIIADDFATDGLRLYNTNASASLPPMPTVERLAHSGVSFRNAYSYPTCSPSRSPMLTARYRFRTGIGYALANPLGPTLQADEFTLPKALSSAAPNLRHGMVGKWHLSFHAPDPNTLGGFDWFSGGILGELKAYDDWPQKVTNGVTLGNILQGYTNYATTDNLNDATNWISAQGTNSWFLWLAFNACHEPLHLPPAGLHAYTNLSGAQTNIDAHPRPYYEAMAQSLDTSVSNVLAFLGPQTNQTTVIFLGDNGTPSKNIQPPYSTNQCKGTLYEGGIRVPLIVAGPKVASPNRWSEAVVSTVDLYATILELASVNLIATLPTNLVFDSQSFLPVITNATYLPPERFILAENFNATIPDEVAGRAARNTRYKLIQFNTGVHEMYDLATDPYEGTNLLDGTLTSVQQTNYVALTAQLSTWNPTPQPQVQSYRLQENRFGVTATHADNVRCWLWRSTDLHYPVWTVLTNAASVTLSGTNTILADTNLPPEGAFYRVTGIAADASTNFVGVWKTWD